MKLSPTIPKWHNCFDNLAYYPSKDFLRKVFIKIEKVDDIEEFAQELGLTTAKEYVFYFFPQVNSNSLVQYLDLWFRRFQSYQHRIDNDINNSDNIAERHYFTVQCSTNIPSTVTSHAIYLATFRDTPMVCKNPLGSSSCLSNLPVSPQVTNFEAKLWL
jgi:hypothetical protein